MADRHTLAITKIDDFRDWLVNDGWEIQDTKGKYEVLRATKTGRRHPLIIYKRNNAPKHLTALDRDMGVVRAYIRDARKKIQQYTYEHRGYILQQSSYNWHYIIFDGETEEAVLIASCTSKLTEEEAREHIDIFLKMRGEWATMATYEEILKDINKALESNQDNERLAMIKQAIEKQIPMAAENIGKNHYIPLCPRCGHGVMFTRGTKNCDECGQAVIFEEED